MNKLIIILILFISANSVFSQWVLMSSKADSLASIGRESIYNVDFETAENAFEEVIDLYPDHPVGYFLSAMVDWWKITLYRSTNRYDDNFLDKIEDVIDVCDNILDENSLDIRALFFKAGALGYRGRYYAQNEKWFDAAKDGSEAYNLLKKCIRLAPTNYDIMLGTGLYNYFAKAIPMKYPIAKPLMKFFPKGDITLGLYQLRASSERARYANVEAEVVLMQIYYNFENNNEKAMEYASILNEKYPNNPYFHRYLGRALVREGNFPEFERTWREILKRCIDRKTGYDNLTAREAMYYIGIALMKKHEYDMALKYFEKCAEGSQIIDKESESGFYVNAIINAGKIYDIKGDRELALQKYKRILKMKDYDDSHNKANRYINKPYGK